MPDIGRVTMKDLVYFMSSCDCSADDKCARVPSHLSMTRKACCASYQARNHTVAARKCKIHGLDWHVNGKCIKYHPVKECMFDHA